ncbi:MAG: PEP-CTERM sorting domain-containing protein [Chloroflexota bacterium]
MIHSRKFGVMEISVLLLLTGLLAVIGYALWQLSQFEVREVKTGDSLYVPIVLEDVTPTATATPDRRIKYAYEANSMAVAPNCGSVYLSGYVVDVNSNPLNDITVELQFWDNRIYRDTGKLAGWPDGFWSFAPLSQERFRTAIPFNIRLVESKEHPLPISETLHIDFYGCHRVGQYTNIHFVQTTEEVARHAVPRFVQPGQQFQVNLAGDSSEDLPTATSTPVFAPSDEPVNVPEPFTIVLFATGLSGLAIYSRKKGRERP